MRIEKVTYEKVFPLAPYVNEKIGVSYILMKNDDPKAALLAAKQLCEEFHNESKSASLEHQFEPVPDIHVKKSTAEHLADEINSCKDVKVLESYKLIVKNDCGLQLIYDNKLKQLNNE